MAEFEGERIGGPARAHSGHGSGFIADVKEHKIEVIIGGATLLLTLVFLMRGKSGNPKPANAGNLLPAMPTGSTGSTASGVTSDTLTAAIASVTQQEQADMQAIQQQIASLGQTVSGLGHGGPASSGAGGIPGYPGGSNVPGGQGYPGSGPVVQGNGNAITNALQARNKLGDTTIVSFFSALSLPSWIGLQYVAENLGLPWSPGSTPTSAQLSSFNNWLDSHGYRNASTNAFTSLVSSSTVPANVQAEIDAAYGG